MVTISLCMIVKNEEAILSRCLDSVADLMDEIIIVDTGSSDGTKEIAKKYTSKVFDFTWIDDFSAARNFAFSKATMDYIYSADADEMLDEENRERFKKLKEVLLPEVELVQMKYVTQGAEDAVQNVKKEYRPKLFKRLREWTWIDPVHETVRTDPVVYDSEVEIQHMPVTFHGKRDFIIFRKAYSRQGALSKRLASMYAKELFKLGNLEEFRKAEDIFVDIWQKDPATDNGREAGCVLARLSRLENDAMSLMKYATRELVHDDPCAEMCYELGMLHMNQLDYEEAVLWLYNAAYEALPIIDIHTHGDLPLNGLVTCYVMMIDMEQAKGEEANEDLLDYYRSELAKHEKALDEWEYPEEF